MECPDKLEPREPQYLTSVLKNVPVELMWHLREYHSKPSHFEIKWRARQPVEGKKYGYGGDLKWEDAQSGDMYVRDRVLEEKHSELRERYREQDGLLDEMLDNEKELKNKNADLKRDLDVLQYDKDVLTGLLELEDASVQTCVTSPPYWGLRDYGEQDQLGSEETPEGYVANMVKVFSEVKRVLTKDGTLWLNLGDSYCGTGHKGDHVDPKHREGRNGQKVAINNKIKGLKSNASDSDEG